MDPKHKFALGNILSVIGAAVIAAACRNLELVEGIVLAIAAVTLFFGAWMSATEKAKIRPREKNSEGQEAEQSNVLDAMNTWQSG